MTFNWLQAPALDMALTSSKRTLEIFLRRLTRALDADWTLENMALECGPSRSQFAPALSGTDQHDPGVLSADDTARRGAVDAGGRPTLGDADRVRLRILVEPYSASCCKRRFGFTPPETPEKQRPLVGSPPYHLDSTTRRFGRKQKNGPDRQAVGAFSIARQLGLICRPTARDSRAGPGSRRGCSAAPASARQCSSPASPG